MARAKAKDAILALIASEPGMAFSLAQDQLYEYTRLCMRHQLKAWLAESANQGTVVAVDAKIPNANLFTLDQGFAPASPRHRGIPQIRPMIVQ
jgi:hypothetical protein